VHAVEEVKDRIQATTEEFDLFVENFAVEEEDGAEYLVLCGCGDSVLCGEVDEKGVDLGGTHVVRIALIVKEDEAAR